MKNQSQMFLLQITCGPCLHKLEIKMLNRVMNTRQKYDMAQSRSVGDFKSQNSH